MPLPPPPAELHIDARLVRRLLRDQHPDLADLPLRRLGTGWDTEVYRLGRDLTVRVPRRALGAQLVDRELRWLPDLAPRLPWPVPEPVHAGEPTAGFPWPWSVCRFVPGRPIGARGLAGEAPGEQLAEFLKALHVPAPPDAPTNPFRGVALDRRDDSVRAVLTQIAPAEREQLERLWTAGLGVPAHDGPPVWLHGDLHALNLLGTRGRITGVVDFGDLCAGDPATDLAVAWIVLDRAGRERLRRSYTGPSGRWERGRGWAAFFAVMFLAHSADAPGHAGIGRRTLAALLADRAEPARGGA
jgi:aminoglycoside phosphotransferase (APT) family kinase protein